LGPAWDSKSTADSRSPFLDGGLGRGMLSAWDAEGTKPRSGLHGFGGKGSGPLAGEQ
jgi:hypothetical protein